MINSPECPASSATLAALSATFDRFRVLAANVRSESTSSVTPETSALTRCISAFARLRNAASDTAKPFELSALKAAFADFAALMARQKACGELLNVFDLCGVGRDEMKNCAILAWLLDENVSHGQGSRFLRGLLGQCANPGISQQSIAGGYATRTEFCPNADQADRVDIVCDGRDFLLYIEVKIDSHEHGQQTVRYHEKLRRNAGSREYDAIFLASCGVAACGRTKTLTWRDVASLLGEMAAEAASARAHVPAALFSHYAGHVSRFQE